MPCTITDKIGYRTAAGVHTAIPNLPVYAVPGLSALTFDTGGTYRPNAARNPLIVGNPALDHGQIAITDGSGQFSLTRHMRRRHTRQVLNRIGPSSFPMARWCLAWFRRRLAHC